MQETKGLLSSKTFWFNVISALVLVAGYFGYADHVPDTQMAGIIHAIMPVVVALLPVGNLVLRLFTKAQITSVK
jgi:hypothetical protein